MDKLTRYWVRKDAPGIITMTYGNPPTDQERWTELYPARPTPPPEAVKAPQEGEGG